MCNSELTMALSASVSNESSSSRLFRPWDAVVDKKSASHRKRTKMLHSRRDSAAKIENIDVKEASASPAALPLLECRQPLLVERRVDATLAATTADALYADLTRADLARLGLVCPADYARLRARKQRPKKFRCPHCQVAFSNNGQLRGHIRIHTGERPFACQHEGCGKAFTRNEELTRHRRIHSGIRPYPCPACGKRFGRKDHLKKHARTHQKVVALTHHSASTTAAAVAAAAFNAAAAGLFPLDSSLLPSLVPYPYPGVFGF